MDERIHDLFGHLAIGGTALESLGSEANSAGKTAKSMRNSTVMAPGDSKDAVTVHLMCYANKESRHGEEPAPWDPPRVRIGRSRGRYVARGYS